MFEAVKLSITANVVIDGVVLIGALIMGAIYGVCIFVSEECYKKDGEQ